MNRRGFVHVLTQMRAAVGLAGVVEDAAGQQSVVRRENVDKPTFRELEWVWEGQGIDP